MTERKEAGEMNDAELTGVSGGLQTADNSEGGGGGGSAGGGTRPVSGGSRPLNQAEAAQQAAIDAANDAIRKAQQLAADAVKRAGK